MKSDTIPQAAIDAAAAVLGRPPSGVGMSMAEWDRERAAAILKAAAPHLAAAWEVAESTRNTTEGER